MPVSSATMTVTQGGTVIAREHREASLFQVLGTKDAVSVLAIFGLLSLALIVAAILQSRRAEWSWLAMVWVAAAFTAAAAASLPLGGLFWASMVLALALAVLAAVRQGAAAPRVRR